MMAYADFEFYINKYMGKAIYLPDFDRLALRASSFLDYYTQGMAAQNHELEALKMACCAVAEQYQIIEQAREMARKSLAESLKSDGCEVQSESVGSWSKTFRSAGDSAGSAASVAANARASLSAVAREYLAGTGLLYRGRRC